MKSKHNPPAVSIAAIHFRGIKPGAKLGPMAGHPTDAATPKRRPQARIKFAGIGGGGYSLAVLEASREAEEAAREAEEGARIARQRRIDALLDQTAAAAGITKPRRG